MLRVITFSWFAGASFVGSAAAAPAKASRSTSAARGSLTKTNPTTARKVPEMRYSPTRRRARPGSRRARYSPHREGGAAPRRAAYMQETTEQLTTAPEAMDAIVARAPEAESWAGEPFLHADEEPAVVLAPGTARRRALDDALAELDAGRRVPSSQWKVRYGLMLGLERVLSQSEPELESATKLRRHQVDALAGMLTELIAANQKDIESANGNGFHVEEADVEEDDDDEPVDEVSSEDALEVLVYEGPDPGAVRRYRFRHPTASGKTIAAAGFVEAARTLGVLILTHRRLLVSQFTRDLSDEGYGGRLTEAIEAGQEPLRADPLTIQTYAWFARHVGSLSRDAYQLA